MKWLWTALDTSLFSPPHCFESVVRTTDLLLQASDPDYLRYRFDISSSVASQTPKEVEGVATHRPIEHSIPR